MYVMALAKVAITVPKEVLERARLAVKRGEAASLSAYVTRALEKMNQNDDDLDAHLDEMLARTGGPMTEAEIERIDGFWEEFQQRRRQRTETGK